MDKIDIKKEKRHARLLELGLGTKVELVEHISRHFMSGIIHSINRDTQFKHRTQNKEVFENALMRSSKEIVENFILSFDKETLDKMLITFNKLENGKN